MSRDLDKNRTAPVESEYKTNLKTEFEPVIVKKKGINFTQKFIIFLMLVVVILAIALGISINKNKKNTEPVENSSTEIVHDEPTQEQTVLEVKKDSDFSTDLYLKIPVQDGGFEPYYSGTTTVDDISASQKLLFVLRRMEDEYQYDVVPNNGLTESDDVADIKKFELQNVEIAYRTVFGSVKALEPMTVDRGDGYIYEYSESSQCFYGHTAPGGRTTDYKYERDIDKVEQAADGSEVYVYENLLFFTNDDAHEKAYALYKNTDKKDVIIDNIKRDIVDGKTLFNGVELDALFDQYDGQGGNFKHTFKRDENGNYFWYSTEYIN